MTWDLSADFQRFLTESPLTSMGIETKPIFECSYPEEATVFLPLAFSSVWRKVASHTIGLHASIKKSFILLPIPSLPHRP